jgi:hypothetical protein
MRVLELDGLDFLGLDFDELALGERIPLPLLSLSTTRPVSSSTICWRRRWPVFLLIW